MITYTMEHPIAAVRVRGESRDLRWTMLLYVLALAAVLCGWRAASLLASESARVSEISLPAGVVADFGRRSSHGGLYRAEVVAATPVRVGAAQQWTVRLARRDGRRLAHARLQLRSWMPETGEESPVRPTATYAGGGEYRLDGVRFTRPGWWNVALVVDGRAGVDSLAFNVRVPE